MNSPMRLTRCEADRYQGAAERNRLAACKSIGEYDPARWVGLEDFSERLYAVGMTNEDLTSGTSFNRRTRPPPGTIAEKAENGLRLRLDHNRSLHLIRQLHFDDQNRLVAAFESDTRGS